MEEGMKAFCKLLELHTPDKKTDLFQDASEEGRKVQIIISGIKLPRDAEAQVLKIRLPHHHTPESRGVCPDHEATVLHYESLLAEKGVKGITKVMALRELKVEYKTFESKRALCHLYDHFLADARIIRLLPQFLGKAFYKRKKFPVQVSLTHPSLASELDRALHTVCLPLRNAGSASVLTLGLSVTPAHQLIENLRAAVRVL